MMGTVIIGISIGIVMAFLTSLVIPIIWDCGTCKKRIYWWQSKVHGIYDKHHKKCFYQKIEGMEE